MKKRVLIYYKNQHDVDRWFKGDHIWRAPIRRVVRGPDPIGGIDLVCINLCRGLDRLGIEYETNLSFESIRPSDQIGVIGRGRACLEGYSKQNPILAGVAVVEHPREWPTLFEEYPVSHYVVHCGWVKDMFETVYGPRIVTWAVGIDTDHWSPAPTERKSVDFLIYDKVRWEHDRIHRAIVEPILSILERRGLTTETIHCGAYKPDQLRAALGRARALLFLCEHETQGLAYQQAMSAGLPILAWEPGQWLDPWRFHYGESYVPATSVPFFDERCGCVFKSAADFEPALEAFLENLGTDKYAPRDYVLENLTLEKCAQDYLERLEEASA